MYSVCGRMTCLAKEHIVDSMRTAKMEKEI